MKQKLFTLFLALVANVVIIYASNTQVGGIWFVFDEFNKTATVTYHGSYYNDYSNEYSGSVVIPALVFYNGITFSVTSIGREAFSGCSKLTSITIPNSVTSIGEEAFSGTGIFTNAANWKNGALYINDCLIEVTGSTSGAYSIESGTRLIANGAFRGCSSLTSVIIPNSVTSIGSSAFYGTGIYDNAANWKNGALYINDCLIEVTGSTSGAYSIESGTRLIAEHAFQYCSSLTSVTIPNSVTSIGHFTFQGCSSLTSVTIPNSVTSIGDNVFKGCSSLTSVILTALSEEEFCKGQGNSLLYSKGVNYQREIQINGTKVTKFTIPNSVTSIGDYAFYNCSSLTYVTIPNSVTSIGKEVFYKCSSLTSVTIPNSVTSIGSSVFFGCSSFTSVILTALSEEEFCKGQGNSLLYSKGVNYQREIQINGTKVTKFTIPNSVTSIGNYAFYNCSSITSATIPNSVTSIGDYAFRNCSSLTSITIPNSVTSIGNSAFNGCSSLTSVIIGNGVTSIGNSAFNGCSSLTSVIIGNGVTSIGGGAFYKCSSLTSITIPNSVTSIGDYAFYECTSLTSITIPNSVTSIGDYAFQYCSSLTSVTIGNSVTSIGEHAFQYCSSLTSVTIGNGVTSIGDYAFSDCWSLPEVNNIRYADTYLVEVVDKSFDTYTIKEGTKWIGDYAFSDCSSLTSLTIPNSVTSIRDYAFFNCSSLTSVTIGNSVRSIGDYAFNCEDEYQRGHNHLESVVCRAEKPAIIGISTFEKRGNFIDLYVPCGCGDAYRAAEGWNDFNAFPEMEGYSIFTFVNDAKMGTAEVNNRTCKNAQIVATPKPGFRFVQWSDGVVNNPRSIVLTQDTTLIAEFAEVPSYVVEVVYNSDHGTVNGQGTYKEDEEVTLTATANDGYKFHKWSNGVTDNPYTFIVKSDVTLEAKFTSTEGIEDVLSSEVHTTKVIRDGQVLILRNGKTYTMQGQEVK